MQLPFCLIHSCAKLNWNVCISKHDFIEQQILVAINFATCRRHFTIMHNLVIMLSLSFLLLCFSYSTFAREIVISNSGKDTPTCLEGLDVVSCSSLVNVSRYVSSHKLNNLIIRINNTNYTLQGVAKFNGVKNITITGEGRSLTHINCNTELDAGIVFDNSSDICLQDFTVSNCSTTTNLTKSLKQLQLIGNYSAIKIDTCSNVSVFSIAVSRSRGQGLTLIDVRSAVHVNDSHFTNNSITNRHRSGGGLQIIFNSKQLRELYTDYIIDNCVFKHNIASNRTCNQSVLFRSYSWERGAGIRILLGNACKNIRFTLKNSKLEENKAIYGGAMQIYSHGNATNNAFHLYNNLISNNIATCGGGGFDIGYTTGTHFLYPVNNTINITNSSFLGNTASLGGGMYVFVGSVGLSQTYANNSLFCINCTFKGNTALSGSAAFVSRDLRNDGSQQSIISTNFVHCTIESNHIIADTSSARISIGSGAFFISNLPIIFSGLIEFLGNNGTALYLNSASVKINNKSVVIFTNNSGYQGGAVALNGNSQFLLDNSGHFYFYNNSATHFGGAICVLSERTCSYLGSCFLKLKHPGHYQSKKLYFYFSGNSATAAGNDIFSSSLSFCDELCGFYLDRLLNRNVHFFNQTCYGNFTFFDGHPITKSIATLPVFVETNYNNSTLIIRPGISTSLKIHQLDELGKKVDHLFPLTAKVQSSNMTTRVQLSYTLITNNSIVLFGMPGDTGIILLEGSTVRHTIKFKISPCSPGYHLDNEKLKCVCSAHYKSKLQIIKCKPNGLATVDINYWIGYRNHSLLGHLYTGLCLTQLCHHNKPANCDIEDRHCHMPLTRPKLEKVICGENRQGWLCGRCVEDKVVYYHSPKFTCGDSTNCQYGVLIYIVSELIPVTIIFLVILLFNISLTSGALYSFVFYVQVVSRLDVTAFGTIQNKDALMRTVLEIVKVILGVFAFEIKNESLEFCILQTNTIMDLFLIKYATLAYAFVLFLATIFILRVHSCYSCVKLCRRCGRRNIKGSMVDGLSAFLVMCYFQCAVVTSSILTPSNIMLNNAVKRTVAMYDGEMDYLRGEHLWFATPAFLCLIIILIPPPTILILEPILTKLFSIKYFNRSRVSWLYNRLRLKLMPFLDSFQACFKDNHRYFAGLYFLYRLLIPLLNIFIQTPEHYYGIIGCLFLVILLLHIFVQPYKKKWYNLLELSLIINIVFLLMITLYNSYIPDNIRLINVQLFLIVLSFGYITVYAAIKIHQKYPFFKRCSRKCSVSNENVMSNSFPYRMLDDDDTDSN